ncbi:hypothetical protein AJ88_03005 [Mesorhizobium amorphae CCBAU 01583]|nr:hypothetical protein AJ88_03005 [Mesorhizobium amorphae CCBAU 01583]
MVAIGWGRAIREVIRAGLPRIPGVLTVAATGGMQQQAAHFQINEFVRLAAEEFGGTPHFIHAPYLPSTELRDVFLGDAAISDSVALWDRTVWRSSASACRMPSTRRRQVRRRSASRRCSRRPETSFATISMPKAR